MSVKTQITALFLAFSLLAPVMLSAKGKASNNQQQSSLSSSEEATLLWMREEEKLARDVYLKLYKKWGAAIFNNIAQSEQSHMEALLKIIDTYGLVDPVISGIGNFNNEALQALYYELVAQGNESYMSALEVGATIEDMDIMDISFAIEETDELALQTTYQSLLEGSKNHLRSFVNLLGDYDPQYIEDDLYIAIISF